MKIEKIVGLNVARLRLRRDWSQPELGRQIEKLAGRPWSRQAVSNAENGARAFTVADLVTLAYVLEVPPSSLMILPTSEENVEVGDVSIPRSILETPAWMHESTATNLLEVSQALGDLKMELDRLQDAAYPVWQHAGILEAATIRLRLRAALEEKGAAIPADYQ